MDLDFGILEERLKAKHEIIEKLESENGELVCRLKNLEDKLYEEEKVTCLLKERISQLTKKEEQKEGNPNTMQNKKGDEEEEKTDSKKNMKSKVYDIVLLVKSLNNSLIKAKPGVSLFNSEFQTLHDESAAIQNILFSWLKKGEEVFKLGESYTKGLFEFSNFILNKLNAFEKSPDLMNEIFCLAEMQKEFCSFQDALNFAIKGKSENQKKLKEFDYELEMIKDDYISLINQVQLDLKIDIVDKLCVYSYSYISYFKEGYQLTQKMLPRVHSSTEKTSVRLAQGGLLLKHLEEDRKLKQNEIEDDKTPNKQILDKEGLLFKKSKRLKDWELGYCKVKEGNLLYFKFDKHKNTYNFTKPKCEIDLFLCKIKKIESDPALQFEIMSAKDGKSTQMHGITEKSMLEWIIFLNSISANLITYGRSNLSSLPSHPSIPHKKRKSTFDNQYQHSQEEHKYSYENPLHSDHYHLQEDSSSNNNNMASHGPGLNAALPPLDNLRNKIYEENPNLDILIRSLISNYKCSDCDQPYPEWCLSNLCLLLCINCSSVHRKLGLARVKSLNLDLISPENLKLIQFSSQNDINSKIIQFNNSQFAKQKKQNNSIEQEQFIIDKYKNKMFIKKIDADSDCNQENCVSFACEAISKGDFMKFFHYFLYFNLNLDNCFSYKERKKTTFLHLASEHGHCQIIQFILLNGGNLELMDDNHCKPIDLAVLNNQIKAVDLILRKMDERQICKSFS